jgi:peptidoglycan/LPS O-acetylase OafA/YrhL
MKRIPTLDGWRGLAILLVLFDHFQDSLMGRYLRPWTQTGQHGVTIFFVLSGFLITSKLLQGPINLGRFYVGRFFRLMPAAWTYLTILLLLDWLTGAHFTSMAGVRACVFFYRNFAFCADSAVTGHFWSLSLEEQFYLVWPCVLLFAGAARCRWIAVLAAIACAAYRWFFWAHYDQNLLNGQSQIRADALLIGCLLALLFEDPRILAFIARGSRLCAFPACACLAFCIARFHWLPPLFESVSIAGLIAFTTLHPTAWMTRPLSSRLLAWLGLVSYSLYLWQELFTLFHSPIALFIVMPLAALASYYGIERPSIRFGNWLMGASAQDLPNGRSASDTGLSLASSPSLASRQVSQDRDCAGESAVQC